MATHTKIILVDDVNGEQADETINFGLDGAQYEIDLSTENAARLRHGLSEFIGHARKVGGRKKTGPVRNDDPHHIRLWAQNNGIKVSQRGRVPSSVIDAYKAAQH